MSKDGSGQLILPFESEDMEALDRGNILCRRNSYLRLLEEMYRRSPHDEVLQRSVFVWRDLVERTKEGEGCGR